MIGVLSLAVAGGCHAPAAPSEVAAMTFRVGDYDAFFDQTLTLLRENDLPPARVDRAAGRIETAPTTSGQWFEFWRIDAPGAYQALESSLHTIQRRVSVTVTRADEAAARGESGGSTEAPAREIEPKTSDEAAGLPGEGGSATTAPAVNAGTYRVAVQVEKSRYNAPERQVTTASGALAIYSERLPTNEGLFKARDASERWIPIGRDGLLESLLLERIARLPTVEPD